MHLIGGIILVGLAIYFWFGLVHSAEEKSVVFLVRMIKNVFGAKGYVIAVRFLAIFMLLAAVAEFYKHFK